MKTLHANGALVLPLGSAGAVGIAMILLGIYAALEGDTDTLTGFLLMTVLLLFVGAVAGMRIYRTHWIKYGDGTIIVRRVSKELVNGRPVGKWQNREDTILLKDLELYGVSREILGHDVEYHRSGAKGPLSIAVEWFFQLKDGKVIGFEAVYYTRWQAKELFRYIYEETGIKFNNIPGE